MDRSNLGQATARRRRGRRREPDYVTRPGLGTLSRIRNGPYRSIGGSAVHFKTVIYRSAPSSSLRTIPSASLDGKKGPGSSRLAGENTVDYHVENRYFRRIDATENYRVNCGLEWACDEPRSKRRWQTIIGLALICTSEMKRQRRDPSLWSALYLGSCRAISEGLGA